MVKFEKNNKLAKLTQELYGYPSLQELYLSGEVNIEDWRYIIEKLFILHKKFEKYTAKIDSESLLWLYFDKTAQRMQELLNQNEYWCNIFEKDYITINGKKYKNINLLKPLIEDYAKKLSENSYSCVTHGDYCFSNILFDSSNYVFKLIDPRGRLDKEATIYGDARYDIAKLRHSIVGLYDFIVQGLFKLEETEQNFEYKILTNKDYSILEPLFDKYCTQNGFNPNDVKFIEGLLFLSMIPLHKENFDRQKVFFIKSIELLNSSTEKEENSLCKTKSSEYALT
jgi:hypothetical protein